MRTLLLIFLTVISISGAKAQVDPSWIMPVREQAEWIDSMLEYRIDSLLPKLMEREGVDMWILISREYNEDPVMKTILPSSWLSARRRTMMVFNRPRNGGELEKIAIARYSVGSLLKGEWNIDVHPDQWEALMSYIVERDPQNIAINKSKDFGLADGIVHTEYSTFMEKLPESFHNKVISGQDIAIAWS